MLTAYFSGLYLKFPVSPDDRRRCFALFEASISVQESTLAAVIEFPDAARGRSIDNEQAVEMIKQSKFVRYMWERLR
jgi:hypothetical protein